MSQRWRARVPVVDNHKEDCLSERLVIVGEVNPQSTDPARALWTQPPGCAGHRLWQMATARTGISEEDWLAMTDRRNLCVGGWEGEAATAEAERLTVELAGRTVVVLGALVASEFRRLADAPHPVGQIVWWHERDWVAIPHPSGLNRVYNNPVTRASVEILLADLIHMHRGDAS